MISESCVLDHTRISTDGKNSLNSFECLFSPMQGGRLPGTDTRDRIILHVDMDCFYASCERRRDPSLRGEPVVVGMGYTADETTGAVATASYEARAHGVESAQAISQALALLPREATAPPDTEPVGYYRPVDMAFYESVSESVQEILTAVADTVRNVSIDEAYLDVTDQRHWSDIESFASKLKTRIREEVGVPASIGVAPNMATAKVASDAEKPDGLVVVRPDAVESFLAPLPVEALHGVGPVTASTLAEMGIETVADLTAHPRMDIVDQFGSRGADIYDQAHGIDERAVEPVGNPKSLSNESAFAEPTTDRTAVAERLASLTEQVTDRATNRGVQYKTVGIKVVTPPFEIHTRERSLSGPIDDPELVASIVTDLSAEFEDEPIRKLGVRLSNLSFDAAEQSSLEQFYDETDSKNQRQLLSATTRQSSLFEFC